MGKPAARLTDKTAHGGMITGPGNPTVLISKLPAATLGDMHVCPMVNPGPVPHVGGPIALGSTGVLIGKKPAARMGDMAICVGPPSSIILGGMTVMIGEVGGGSGGAGSGASAAAAKKASGASVKKAKSIKGPKSAKEGSGSSSQDKGADKKKVSKVNDKPSESKQINNYSIEAQFVDSAGLPLSGVHYTIKDSDGNEIIGVSSTSGCATHGGYSQQGSYTLSYHELANPKWSVNTAKVKEKIKISVAADIDASENEVTAYIQGKKGSVTEVIKEIQLKVENKTAKGEFLFESKLINGFAEKTKENTTDKLQLEFMAVSGSLVSLSEPVDVELVADDTPVDENTNIKKAETIEIPDVLFNLNSATPCLDADGVLLSSILTTLDFALNNASKEVVVFGHTDTSGDVALNYKLSELRAKAIKALLDGDKKAFAAVANKNSRILDYQMSLKTLATMYDWTCDPGNPDDEDGPKTQSAVRNFIAEYNRKFSGNLKEDEVFGVEVWEALGEVIIQTAQETFDKEWPKVKYGYGGKGLYACGESFPIDGKGKDEYVSETNRRVEVVFWEKAEAPNLKEPANKSKRLTSDECPVYDDVLWEQTIVVPKPVPVIATSDKLTIEITPDQELLNHDHILSLSDGAGYTITLPIEKPTLKTEKFSQYVFKNIPANSKLSLKILNKNGQTLQEIL